MHSRLSKSCGAFNCASMQDTPNRSFAEQGHSLLHFALSSTLWGTVCMYDDDYFFLHRLPPHVSMAIAVSAFGKRERALGRTPAPTENVGGGQTWWLQRHGWRCMVDCWLLRDVQCVCGRCCNCTESVYMGSRASLLHATLIQRPDSRTLSYTWGCQYLIFKVKKKKKMFKRIKKITF